MNKQLELRACASLVALTLSGVFLSPAMAQSAPADAANAADGQAPATAESEIVVQGFRQSLQRAAEIKRSSAVISDVISAEDIGKFPDQNLADSLQRVTGVQITRSNGAGSRVSVRGLSPDFTQLFYNGRVMPSPNGGRSFDFSNLASDFVSSVEVMKTPTADQIDGGLAATININTARPLDVGSNRFSISAETAYEEKAKKATPLIAALANRVLVDGQLGVSLGVNYEKRRYRSDALRAFGFENGVEAARSPRLDYNRDGDFNDTFRFNHEAGAQVTLGETERWTVIGGIQAKLGDHVEVYGDGLYTRFHTLIDQPVETLRFTNIICPTAQQGTAPGGCIRSSTITDGRVSALDADGVDNRNVNVRQDNLNEIASGALGVKLQFGAVDVRVEGTAAKATRVANTASITAISRGSASYAYSNGPDQLPVISFNRGYDPLLKSNFRALGITGDYKRPTDDDNRDLRADLKYTIGDGFLRSLMVGGRVSLREQTFGTSRMNVTAAQLAPLLGVPTQTGIDGVSIDATPYMRNYTFDGLLSSAGNSAFPTSFISSDINELFKALPLSRILAAFPAVRQPENEYTVRESVKAAYARLDFGIAGDALSGNIGVRYVSTDQTSLGNAPDLSRIIFSFGTSKTTIPGITPTEIKRHYKNWLPSLNLKYEITPDLVARVGAARVMSRPTLVTLSPSTTIDANTRFIRRNNPFVNPFVADQVDVSLEYYLGGGGLLSLAGFYKDAKNFVVATTSTLTVAVTSAETGATVPLDFTLSQPNNGSGAKLKGFEAGAQLPFTFLPGPFSGLGVIANYTYIDAGGAVVTLGQPAVPLPGVSKHSYNLVGYYEKGPFSARLAYNYRSKFVVDAASTFGDGEYGRGYGQLDASINVDVLEDVSVTLEAQNIANAAVRSINSFGYLRGYENVGPRYTAGVRAKFR